MMYLPGLLIALALLLVCACRARPRPSFSGFGVIAVLLTLLAVGAAEDHRSRCIALSSRAAAVALHAAGWSVEIVKANIAVIARVLGPRHAIDPAMVQVCSTRARTDLGKALFANSITLTPGTVTVDVDGDKLKVHALVRENASVASFEPMDRRAARAADSRQAGRAEPCCWRQAQRGSSWP